MESLGAGGLAVGSLEAVDASIAQVSVRARFLLAVGATRVWHDAIGSVKALGAVRLAVDAKVAINTLGAVVCGRARASNTILTALVGDFAVLSAESTWARDFAVGALETIVAAAAYVFGNAVIIIEAVGATRVWNLAVSAVVSSATLGRAVDTSEAVNAFRASILSCA